MPIFQIKNKKTEQVSLNINHFRNEAELRDFFAGNLEELLGMRFLAKEFPTTDGRIDTLALDESNAPVIIEYKWGQDNAIVVQGLFYYEWLKKNKRHIELFVADKLGKDTKVNWDRPRVVLVSQGFDNRTIVAVQHFDFVELIKYTPYKNDILHLENVYTPKNIRPVRENMKPEKTEDKDDEPEYNLEYHLARHNSTDEIKNTFGKLQEKIKALPEVEEIVDQKSGITYRTTKSFTRLEFGKTMIDILLREPKYNDPKNMVDDIASFEWGYKGRAKIKSTSQVDDVFDLIKQSYESTL
jgi:predicted transport protein